MRDLHPQATEHAGHFKAQALAAKCVPAKCVVGAPFYQARLAENFLALVHKVYRAMERHWHRMQRTRSWAGAHLARLPTEQRAYPIAGPKLCLPYGGAAALAML